MRNKSTASSMQKTYDDCYLICSTAVYFEGQNNEAEALRSWRSALDRIYYHNAYRVPPDYRPRSETEKALQDSLREMELQCRERIGILEALIESRAEAQKGKTASPPGTSSSRSRADVPYNHPAAAAPAAGTSQEQRGWLGQGTIPVVGYSDIVRPAPHGPPVPPRPSSPNMLRAEDHQQLPVSAQRPALAVPTKPLSPNPPPLLPKSSRTPSPEKKTRMRTTLRSGRDDKKSSKQKRSEPKRPQAASKAAGLAWDSISKGSAYGLGLTSNSSEGAAMSASRISFGEGSDARRQSEDSIRRDSSAGPPSPSGHQGNPFRNNAYVDPLPDLRRRPVPSASNSHAYYGQNVSASNYESNPAPPRYTPTATAPSAVPPQYNDTKPPTDFPVYRNEYPTPKPISQASITSAAVRPRGYDAPGSTSTLPTRPRPAKEKPKPPPPPAHRTPIANTSSPRVGHTSRANNKPPSTASDSTEESSSNQNTKRKSKREDPQKRKQQSGPESTSTPSSGRNSPEGSLDSDRWEERLAYIKKNLPRGVDPHAAKQIFNEIVVQGDEVHWDDVAGLDAAKKALKEAVVYPFLRPDLFMGLREPARGMLLFGPPGTGKTMLARAVATESRSTFFAISASSLTSKWLGESEKLVRALFALARALAPSIIFVDEIDSLLSSRGGSTEHESTRRIKTEFLIQWSDLQRAAAGKEVKAEAEGGVGGGDASRVLVLAATNLPWAIDEAARRRFVRRQYIPLPEAKVREEQLLTLLGHQKHDLEGNDIKVLVEVTDGYSGSDITALAKDAAMGPLRSAGEALLHMNKEDIRPISFEDFEASLVTIRPSVSKQGLKEFEDWAKEFGERGG